MKIPSRLLAAIAGIAGFLSTASANLSYTDGDLLLGFRATSDPGATQDYVVNLGPASQFTQATGPITVSGLGNILADLEATFGTAWKTRAEVLWGGVATDLAGDPTNTLYATRPRTDVNTQSTAWQRRSNSGQGTTNSIFRAFVSGYTLSDANAVSPKGAIQSTSAANSYASFTSPTVDFGFFGGIEGNFGAGTTGSILDLFRLAPTQQAAGQIYIGSFQLNDSGVLTFTPTAPTAPTFNFESATYSVNENAASGNVTVRVIRGGLTTGTDTVQLDTADGSAVAGTDYTAAAAVSVPFAANVTQADVTIPIANRDGIQGNRNFTAALSNPSAGGSLTSPATTTVTINEATALNFGQIAFSAATYQVAPVNNLAQPNNFTVTLNRTNGSNGSVAVDVAVSGGTLVNGTDYNAFTSPTTVSFAAGETTKTFNIQLKTIAAAKLPGTINFALSNPAGGATLGTPTTTTVTVAAADRIRPVFTLSSLSGTVVTSPTFQVAGLARDNKGIDRVEVRVNGGAPQLAILGTFANGRLTFNLGATGLENGRNRVVVTAFDSSGNPATSIAQVVIYQNDRPALAGAYTGLLTASGAATNNTTGFIALNVTRLGVFTGRVTIGRSSLVVRGLFDNAGIAHFNVTGFTTFAPTAFVLRETVGGIIRYGTIALAIAPDKITGTLKDTAAAVIANIDADRVFFNGTTSVVASNYLANGGNYTVIFPARATQTGLSATGYPQGDGYGTLKVLANGRVSLAGRLADGSPVAANAVLSKDYRWPFFVRLYGNRGVIAGFATFDDSQTDSDLKGANLTWVRPAIPSASYYRTGWPNGILTDLIGSHYALPTGTSAFPGLGADDPVDGNATLEFSDGKLAANVTKTVNISTANVVTNTPADTTFSLAITPASGIVAGRLPHSDGTKPVFVGAIFQKGPNAGAYGYFLSTPPRNVTGESGAFTLIAQ